jgi:hypothetical protein
LIRGLEARRDGVGVAAEHTEALLVHDGAVVEDVEQLIAGREVTHLGHQDLDFERLHLVREDLPEDLGVLVGEAAGVDVAAAVLVTLDVGGAHPGHPQLVELVVTADAGERDAVVDLTHLAQRVGRVLRDDRDPVVEQDRSERAAAGDALARVVGPILHHLLGCDVEGHTHDATVLMVDATARPRSRPRSARATRRRRLVRSPSR